jgi:hypothetical protein
VVIISVPWRDRQSPGRLQATCPGQGLATNPCWVESWIPFLTAFDVYAFSLASIFWGCLVASGFPDSAVS